MDDRFSRLGVDIRKGREGVGWCEGMMMMHVWGMGVIFFFPFLFCFVRLDGE